MVTCGTGWSWRGVTLASHVPQICYRDCSVRFPGWHGYVRDSLMKRGYEASPPVLRGDALKYRRAGPHYAPSGEAFQGSYDLVMRSDTARCFYGCSDAPVQVEIEVTSDHGVEEVITTSVAETDGWLCLSARGFPLSHPTFTVRLSSQASEKTILCKKTKKVTGIKPKCPKGWRLVRP